MPLQPGTQLGPYVIEGSLGAGGMGEVYKARDPRLDRIVAIKTLASHLTSDNEWQHRFDREARAIASLSHPNICAIFDVGQDGWLPGERLLVQSDARLAVVRSDGSIDESVKDLPPAGGFNAVSPDGRWLARIAREGGVSRSTFSHSAGLGCASLLHKAVEPGRCGPATAGGCISRPKGNSCSVPYAPETCSRTILRLFTLDREIREFDVSPDGQRFLVARAPSPDFTPLRLLVNWRAKLAAALKVGS